MHIVSFFDETMSQKQQANCKSQFCFYDDEPPFKKIEIKSEDMVFTEGKRARPTLATDHRQKKLTEYKLNTNTVVIDGRKKDYVVRVSHYPNA